MNSRHYIFGFASLVNLDSLHQTLGRDDPDTLVYRYCHLNNFERIWNVGMDNSIHLENYKHYLDPVTKERPDIFVSFLNIRPAKGVSIQGILFQVSEAELARFDDRERNYARKDVTPWLDVSLEGTAWAYIGLDASVQAFLKAQTEARAVISSAYCHSVQEAFSSLSKQALEAYRASTVNPGIPLRALTLVRHKQA